MTEIELNRLRAKLRRLAFTEEAIDRTLRRFQRDLETFASASRIIEGLSVIIQNSRCCKPWPVA